MLLKWSLPFERKEILLPQCLVKHDQGKEEQVPIHVGVNENTDVTVIYFVYHA